MASIGGNQGHRVARDFRVRFSPLLFRLPGEREAGDFTAFDLTVALIASAFLKLRESMRRKGGLTLIEKGFAVTDSAREGTRT